MTYKTNRIGKKMSKYYVIGFIAVFLTNVLQVLVDNVNIFLLFSLYGVIVFWGSSLYEIRLNDEMVEYLREYYNNDHKKAEQHMKTVVVFRNIKFFVGTIFLSSAVLCLRHVYNSFSEYISALQIPKNIAGYIAVVISNILYLLSPILYSNKSPKFLFKIFCVLLGIVGLAFLGI